MTTSSFRGEKWFLSNMYPCPVEIQGKVYKCAESAYQSAKLALDMPNRAYEQSKFLWWDGFQAKKEVKQFPLRTDWHTAKVRVMLRVLRAKFGQNQELATLLLATGEEELVETNSWGDRFWGVCKGHGQNQLGKLLMQVREELKSPSLRTIVAGSRGITTIEVVEKAVAASGFNISVLLSGAARGVDQLGERWAEAQGIPVERYPAQWDTHGKSAGYRRNEQMAQKAEALIAIWDGESKGTKHMIDYARKSGLKVFVYDCSA
jgi:ribA/ribD-fused uncharacterized protein